MKDKEAQYEIDVHYQQDKKVPEDILLNWETVKDYNLKSGIPNLLQVFEDKASFPLTSENFINYVQERSDPGTLLIIFYQAVINFEHKCVLHEKRFPPAIIDENQLVNASVPFTNRSLVPLESMTEIEAESIIALAQEAEEIIEEYLKIEQPRYIGVPTEFYNIAKQALLSPDTHWPMIFSPSKQYTFNQLNAHFYTDFIHYCFNTNLTSASSKLCLFCGLLLLLFGFTLAFTLIFSDFRPWSMRLFLIPFVFFGLVFMLSTCCNFFPLLGILGKREIEFLNGELILDDNIKKAHLKKALIHLAITFGLTLVLAIIFSLVPGNHLLRAVK